MAKKKAKKTSTLGPEENAQAVLLGEPRDEALTSEGKVAWIILLAMVFLIPIAMSNFTAFGCDLPLTNDIYETVKVSILRIGSTLALAFFLIDLAKNGMKLRTSPLYWIFGAFLIFALISTLTSVSTPLSLFGKYRRYEGLLTYFNYATLLFLSMQYAASFERVKQIARTLCYSSAFVAFYGLLQTFGFEPLMGGSVGFEAGRSYSTYGNPDMLAGFLAFGVFITLGLVLSEQDLKHRSVYWLILLLNLVVSITAYARSIWVGIFFSFVALVVILFLARFKPEKLDFAFFTALAASAALFIGRSLKSGNAVTNFAERISSIFVFDQGSAQTRFLIWDAAIEAIKARPLFGYGPDTFRVIFRRFSPEQYVSIAGFQSVADNVHNYALQLAVTLGIPGALLFYAVGFFVAIISFPLIIGRRLEKTGIDQKQALLYAGFWLAALAYMVHLFFGLSLPGSSFLLFICYGVLIAPLCKSVRVAPLKELQVKILSFVSLAISAVLIFIFGSFFMADGAFMAARAAQERGDLYGNHENLKLAIKLNPFNDFYKTELFQAKSALAILGAQRLIPAINGEPLTDENIDAYVQDADNAALEVIRFNPWEVDNYALIVAYYNQIFVTSEGTNDYVKKALSLSEEQLKLTPTALALRYTYAEALMHDGRFEKAREELEYVMRIDPSFVSAKKLYDRIPAE